MELLGLRTTIYPTDDLVATEISAVNAVGEGIKVGQFRLPDGNLFAIIENPHFELPS